MVGRVDEVGMGAPERGCGGVPRSKEVDGDADAKGWIEWPERRRAATIPLGLGDGGACEYVLASFLVTNQETTYLPVNLACRR